MLLLSLRVDTVPLCGFVTDVVYFYSTTYSAMLPITFHQSAYLFFLLLGTLGCSSPREQPPTEASLPVGTWRATLDIQGQILPFLFELEGNPVTGYEAYLRNGEERILVDSIAVSGDSVYLPMPIFDTEIVARMTGNQWVGHWRKNYEADYLIPFTATHGDDYRFIKTARSKPADVGGRWSVDFADDSLRAVGEFQQEGTYLTGSFLTSTGDYRYLEGNVEGNQLKLSAFDGEHAFLFHATLQEDGTLQGDFWSGKSYRTTWVAERDEDATLADANALTYLKEGYDRIDFTFPNLNGQPVSLTDKQYRNKVVILQIFGTWCPNCLDETYFLTEWYEENKDREVEIIGLAYEQKDDFDYAARRVKKMVNKLGVEYDFLIAGTSDKEAASQTLPMLNRVMSFPTTITVDRNGQVQNIHTGFSGPGTGEHYEEFVKEFDARMDELLEEG